MARTGIRQLFTYCLTDKRYVCIRLVCKSLHIDMNQHRILDVGECYGHVHFTYREFMGLIPHGRHANSEGIFYKSDNEIWDKIYVRGKKVYQNDPNGIRIPDMGIKMKRKQHTYRFAWTLTYKPCLHVIYDCSVENISDIYYIVVKSGFIQKEVYRKQIKATDDRRYLVYVMMGIINNIQNQTVIMYKE